MENINKRKSGIELLKIIAIALIVLCHSIMTMQIYIDFQLPTNDFTKLLFDFLKTGGIIGNTIFFMCSSWFLDEDNSKFKLKKIFSILINASIISIIIMICFVLICKPSFTTIDYLKQIFPVIFRNNWFIPAYCLFYICVYFVNNLTKRMNRTIHFFFNILMFIIYYVANILGIRAGLCAVIGYLAVHCTLTYVKKYMSFYKNVKLNFILLIVFYILYVLIYYNANCIFGLNSIHIHEFISNFNKYTFNPIVTPMIFFLLNIFNSIDINSRIVNNISSCSLFIYCIHENILLRTYCRTAYYEMMLSYFGNQNYPYIIMSCYIFMLVGSLFLALLYKRFINPLVNNISEKIDQLLKRLIIKTTDFIKTNR